MFMSANSPLISQVGGIQLRRPQPLPEVLATFLDSATQGAVLVSFGSAFRVDQVPQRTVEVFVEAFRRLGLPIIWKWEGEVEGLPSNVLVR